MDNRENKGNIQLSISRTSQAYLYYRGPRINDIYMKVKVKVESLSESLSYESIGLSRVRNEGPGNYEGSLTTKLVQIGITESKS